MTIEEKRAWFATMNSTVYSARCEFQGDYEKVRKALLRRPEEFPLVDSTAIQQVLVMSNGELFDTIPDRDIEFEFKKPVNFIDFLNVVDDIQDSHVLLQSLRPVPLEDNDLDRDIDHHYVLERNKRTISEETNDY